MRLSVSSVFLIMSDSCALVDIFSEILESRLALRIRYSVLRKSATQEKSTDNSIIISFIVYFFQILPDSVSWAKPQLYISCFGKESTFPLLFECARSTKQGCEIVKVTINNFSSFSGMIYRH